MASLALLKLHPLPYTVIPSPGAVCPRIEMRFDTTMRSLMLIRPPVEKTTTRLGWETASRREPAPVSLRLVTTYTEPPRPPTALLPKPSAPGKARADVD